MYKEMVKGSLTACPHFSGDAREEQLKRWVNPYRNFCLELIDLTDSICFYAASVKQI